MDTHVKFKLEIQNARQMYTTALLTMTAEGKHCVTSICGKKGVGLPEFQAAVKSGKYAHAALMNVTNIMATWSKECCPIIEPVKAIIRGFAMPNKIGVPEQLAHLDWEEDVFIPKADPGKKIRFMRAVVEITSTVCEIGWQNITVTAYKYPKSFQIRARIAEVDGRAYDIESEPVMAAWGKLLFKGTVEEFEATFLTVYRAAQNEINELERKFIGGQHPDDGGGSFHGWFASTYRASQARDEDDAPYGDGWDEFSSQYDMDI